MTNDLKINGVDAWTVWGVAMGDGFLDTLYEPLDMKEAVTSESRLEDGRRVAWPAGTVRVKPRSLTLEFLLFASSSTVMRAAKNAFLAVLMAGTVAVAVPKAGSEVFKLRYTGKGATHAMNWQRTQCNLSLKFEEDNPKDR
ncbi:MAG: hypothetical protein LIP02_04080 [Bacteroidales bacterium]|nr:hypothetical protein [Bacteroidales bacterium]